MVNFTFQHALPLGSDSVTLPYPTWDPLVYIAFSLVLVKSRASGACQSWPWSPGPLLTKRSPPCSQYWSIYLLYCIYSCKLLQILSGLRHRKTSSYYMTSGYSLNFSGPNFPHMQSGDNSMHLNGLHINTLSYYRRIQETEAFWRR